MNTQIRLVFAFLTLLIPAALPAQRLSPPQRLSPTQPGAPPVPVSLEDRRKALDAAFHDYWEGALKHQPELASLLGDSRYNDRVSNYGASAFNERLAREQALLLRIAAIDPAGLGDGEKRRQDALLERLENDQKAADKKEWEAPFIEASGQIVGIETLYPDLAQELSFATVKDYDDWTARLHLLPEVFAQIVQDLSLGMDDGRVPPKPLLEKELAEVAALAHQKPEDSPLAAPQKSFPSTIPAAEQQRIRTEMLDATAKEVLPAYMRFERYLRASYVPAGSEKPEASTPRGQRDFVLLMMVVDLRARAQEALGPKFDLHAFHDEILNAGLLPLDQFEAQVNAWIDGRKDLK